MNTDTAKPATLQKIDAQAGRLVVSYGGTPPRRKVARLVGGKNYPRQGCLDGGYRSLQNADAMNDTQDKAGELCPVESKRIQGYEGLYSVTRCGRVWSHGQKRRTGQGYACWKGRWLKATKTSAGYPSVGLYLRGKRQTYLVHKLVAEAFLGVCPDGLEVDHRDRNPSNNHVDNLRYVTRSVNNLNNSHKGVCFDKARGRWKAYIKFRGEEKHLGFFGSEKSAIEGRKIGKAKFLTERGLECVL